MLSRAIGVLDGGCEDTFWSIFLCEGEYFWLLVSGVFSGAGAICWLILFFVLLV